MKIHPSPPPVTELKARHDTLKTRQELTETALDAEGQAEVTVDLASAAKRRSPMSGVTV